VWGPGDGRPVEELKVAIDQLLQVTLLLQEAWLYPLSEHITQEAGVWCIPYGRGVHV
jgi:hypothetical protein